MEDERKGSIDSWISGSSHNRLAVMVKLEGGHFLQSWKPTGDIKQQNLLAVQHCFASCCPLLLKRIRSVLSSHTSMLKHTLITHCSSSRRLCPRLPHGRPLAPPRLLSPSSHWSLRSGWDWACYCQGEEGEV